MLQNLNPHLPQFFTTGERPEPGAACPEYRLSGRRLEYVPVLVEAMVLHKTELQVSLIVAPVLEEDLKVGGGRGVGEGLGNG